MKLLSVKSARSIWLLNLGDLNPRGRAIDRDVLSELVKRYSFARGPDIKQIVEARKNNQPVVLEGGVFQAADRSVIDVSLSVYRDGLMADTRCSTSECDRFLDEILSWLHTDLGLLDYRTVKTKKLYVSELSVSTENSLNIINPALNRFAEILGTKVISPIQNIKYELGAIGFWIDPAQNPKHVHFRLEREEDVPFGDNRYYSIAPLETEQHFDVLALLENCLKG